MFNNSDNLSLGSQLGFNMFIQSSGSTAISSQGSSIPVNPRVKCIQWSASALQDKSLLKILSLTGDFSGLGIVGSEARAKQCPATVQQQVFEMLQEPQLQEILRQIETAIRKGRVPEKIELRLCVGEQNFWVEQETVVRKAPTGKLQVFSFWYDITGRKLAEKNQRILRQAVDAIPSWIFLKNTNHQYELVNEAYAGIYGVSPAECVGKTSVELGVPQSIAEKFWVDDCDVFDPGKPKELYAEPIVIDNKLRYLNTHTNRR